jgi:tetratricopeptide (TPR) repeat protein
MGATQAGFEAPQATVAAMPVPYDVQQGAGQQAQQAQFAGAGSATASGYGFSRPQNTRQTFSVSAESSKPAKASLKDRFNELPPAKKAIYASAVLGIIAVLALQGLGSSSSPTPDIATATPQAENTTETRQPASSSSGALSSDISPEFSTLSSDKQKEIESLYAQAEAAKTAGDWQKAFDSSKAILGHVKQYKNTKEILEEAQTYLNEKKLGLVTQSMSSAVEAEEENQERVRLLLESGRKALAESRFQDAIDAFTRASVLDPANTEALQGLAASQAQDKDFKVNIPNATSVGQADPALESILALNQEIEALRTQYLEARNQINNGVPGVALNLLTELETKIQMKSAQIESENRSPASVPAIQAELGDLRIKVIEGIDVAKAQLRSEYQSQLADAQEFAANRQYAQAREIYDRILKAEKSFTDVFQERKKLYDRMISEARNIYQEALIYEAMGDMDLAVDGYRRARDLMVNVEDAEALEYYRKAVNKLQRHFTK